MKQEVSDASLGEHGAVYYSTDKTGTGGAPCNAKDPAGSSARGFGVHLLLDAGASDLQKKPKAVVLVYYAAAKHHLGFYPTPGPIEAFREELAPYRTSKGAVQFPLDHPLPENLITRMAQYRLQEARSQR